MKSSRRPGAIQISFRNGANDGKDLNCVTKVAEGRLETVYHRDSDWVFSSAKSKGKTPRSAGVAGQDYLRPAAVAAGVIPDGYKGRFGWHNLRHSLATFFAANEVSLAVIQSVLRHSKPGTTALYVHRVNAAQISAQGKFLEAINVAKPAA
jgi:site-specific recombinase XerD